MSYTTLTSFSAALTAIGSGDDFIDLDSTVALTANTTIPANVELRVRKGGNFTGCGTYTLTINGPFSAGLYQVFDGPVAGLKEARPEWFGAAADGATNDSAAFGYAINSITTANGELLLAADSYGLSTTVSIGRITIKGVGAGSKIVPLMTDGTPALKVTAGTTLFTLKDFWVYSALNQTNFLAGTADPINATGIMIDESGGSYASRYHIENVLVYGCAVGWDIQGFQGHLGNVWAYNCGIGLQATNMNATRINFTAENCRQDLVLTSSGGVHFDQYTTQGGAHASGLAASTVDGVNGIIFTDAYMEQSRNLPFISFGATTACKDVEFRGGSIAMADHASNDYDIFPLAFDQVDGLEIGSYFSTGSHHNRYSTTTNTKNITDHSVSSSADAWGPHDASKNLGPARNLFPNSNFDLWFRGWPAVRFTRCAASQETTLVRRGANALKLTATAGQTNNYVSFTLNDDFFVTPLRSKTLTLYAWVWIPDVAVFDPGEGSGQDFQPAIVLQSTNGAAVTTTSVLGTHHTARGAWNLMRISHAIQSDATIITCSVYMNSGGSNAAGDEYIVIDSMYLIEGNRGQDGAIINGWIMESDLNPVRGLGGKLIQRVGSAPNDADQTYEVGDQFLYSGPTAGGNIGEVVTTAGTGATMVTKTFGAVAGP